MEVDALSMEVKALSIEVGFASAGKTPTSLEATMNAGIPPQIRLVLYEKKN